MVTQGMALLIASLSFLIVLSISGIFALILRKGKISYIMRNEAGYYSLALSQFLIWTYVIASAFLTIYMIRLLSNVLEPPSLITYNIVVLMGISTLVPVISAGVDHLKHSEEPTKTLVEIEKEKHHFGEMILENGRPTVTRYQMFLWTIVALFIYLLTFFRVITQPESLAENITQLMLPDIDPTLVVLMGLSQGAFLGGKLTMKPIAEEKSSDSKTGEAQNK